MLDFPLIPPPPVKLVVCEMSNYYAAMVMAADPPVSGGGASHLMHYPYTQQPEHQSSYPSSPIVNGQQGPSCLSGSFSSTTSNGGTKRYRHNPYSSEPSTPTMQPQANPGQPQAHSLNTSTDGTLPYPHPTPYHPRTGSGSATPPGPQPLHRHNSGSYSFDPNNSASASMNSDAHSGGYSHHTQQSPAVIAEQFQAALGNLYNTISTTKGRYAVVNALQLQRKDFTTAALYELAPYFNPIASDSAACHVLKTLAESISEDQLPMFVKYLNDTAIIELATLSQHSRRILQVLFERFHSPVLDPIVAVLAREAVSLARTQQGCIAVMKAVELSLPHQRQQLVNGLGAALASLTMDPYGNYVVQALIEQSTQAEMSALVSSAFHGHWLTLSTNKFASNVMEKVVRGADIACRRLLVSELILTDAVGVIAHDGFGNFVLQSIIETSISLDELRLITDAVRPHLGTSQYNRRIDQRTKTRFAQLSESAQKRNESRPPRVHTGEMRQEAPKPYRPVEDAQRYSDKGTSRRTVVDRRPDRPAHSKQTKI